MKSYVIHLIRNMPCEGNLEGRYIGRTESPLALESIAQLAQRKRQYQYPAAAAFYASPSTRCVDTLKILYPQADPEVVLELAECDFGDWENKTAEELQNDPRFAAWMAGGGTAAPPGGESKAEQQARTVRAFRNVMTACGEDERVALVVHGGTIMCLLEALEPSHRFYHWQAPNGGGYACGWDGERLMVAATI